MKDGDLIKGREQNSFLICTLELELKLLFLIKT